MKNLHLGIDIGTQGVRTALIDGQGHLIGRTQRSFDLTSESRMEQSPEEWWTTCVHSLKELTAGLTTKINKDQIHSLTVTSTSGTVIPLNKDHKVLHNALMYSDPRSAEQGKRIQITAQQFLSGGYTGFTSSSGLAKMIWFIENFPGKADKIAHWVHAADYITGKLSGVWKVTDYTNAFKSGYDISGMEWPSYLFDQLGLKRDWMPNVLASGTPIGKLRGAVALETGLPSEIVVTTGCTDGCASQIASGATKVGDWNTTIGTTMVIKGVTSRRILDPLGRLYSHRHPQGYWMPGGASNTGADWVSNEFADELEVLNSEAETITPTGELSYPLRQAGERFPFVCPEATGFEAAGLNKLQRYVSNMEGVAYIERMAYEMIQNEFGEKVSRVYTAGGGSKSDVWLRIRSSALGMSVYKMKYASGAFGAAVLGASQTGFTNLSEAGSAMVQMEKRIDPVKSWQIQYNDHYQRFLDLLQHKGYTQRNS